MLDFLLAHVESVASRVTCTSWRRRAPSTPSVYLSYCHYCSYCHHVRNVLQWKSTELEAYDSTTTMAVCLQCSTTMDKTHKVPPVPPQSNRVTEFSGIWHEIYIYIPFIIRDECMLRFLNYFIHNLQKAHRKATEINHILKFSQWVNLSCLSECVCLGAPSEPTAHFKWP